MATTALPSASFTDAFPCSSKVLVPGLQGVEVPMREITLGDSPDGSRNAPLRVYDTSGPQGCDVREGLPALRSPWVLGRPVESVDHDQALGLEMP
jgi:phosphomethylpyrimidine synthase